MSFLSKILGSSREREIRKLLAETQKQVEKKCKPFERVGLAIIQASTNCRDAVKELIVAPTEKERLEHEIWIFYEFVYFFMHMTMRQAFVQLTAPQMRELQSYLGPLISSVAIDSYFAHWPDDLKQKMTSEFYDKLNEAELEYAECTKFESSEQGEHRLTQKLRALFMKLGSNVSSLSGQGENDLAVVVPVVQIAVEEWKRMGLDSLMAEVKEIT